MLTRDEAERRAIAEYEDIAGNVVLCWEVECYDARDNLVTVMCDPPAVMRVDILGRASRDDALLHWNDDNQLDPYVDVSLLEPHPSFAGLRPSFVYGTCWNLNGKEEAANFQIAPPDMQASYANANPLKHEAQPEFPAISFRR